MELHHLRHFVAVAEELHFGRAARRLNMAQPPLSQSIKRLEVSIGVRLFERTKRQVTLTPAGAVFLIESRQALQQVDRAARLARRAAAGEIGRLSVGFVSRALFCGLPRAVRLFREEWPDVEVQLDEMATIDQVRALRDGSIDLGFLYVPFEGTDEFALQTVERSEFVAVVPSGSALARRKKIRLNELARQPFVVTPHVASPDLQSKLISACREAGFVPNVAQESRQENTMLSLVAGGVGVALMPATARSTQIEGVTFLTVTDLPDYLYSDLAVVWLPRGVSPALQALISIVSKGAKSPA